MEEIFFGSSLDLHRHKQSPPYDNKLMQWKREDWALVDKHRIMIGLKHHTVQVVDHHPGWAALAAEACQKVRLVTGHLIVDMQHVGSTAVPGLSAKPILDLAASVRTQEAIPEIVRRLTQIGYIYRG